MEKKFVINIGRQLGSGGREIGERLAVQLGVSYYDKELIQIASKASGLCSEFFEKADEKVGHSLIEGMFNITDNYLSNETLFKLQSDVIRDLADKGSCVFVGRCADYILKDHPKSLNLFISADIDDRIRRVAAHQKISLNEAESLIEKTDKKRAGYYNYYSNKIWGAAQSYDLCINSSFLGIEQTILFIRRFAEKKFCLDTHL